MLPIKVLVAGTTESEYALIQKSLADLTILFARSSCEMLRLLESDLRIAIIILDIDRMGSSLDFLPNGNTYHDRRFLFLTSSPHGEQVSEDSSLTADILVKPMTTEMVRARVQLQLMHLRQRNITKLVHEQELLFNALFWQAPVGITLSHGIVPGGDEKDDLFDVNPMFERITGRSRNELLRCGWEAITHPEDFEEELKQYRRLHAREISHYEMEKRYLRPDGSFIWVHMIVAALDMEDRQVRKHLCIVQDISERKRVEEALAESERSKSVLLTHLPGMAYRCDHDRSWTMQFVSAGCLELTGYPATDLIHNKRVSYNELIVPEYRLMLWQERERNLLLRLPFRSEYEIITVQGARRWVMEMGQGVFNHRGEVEALEGIILDISERKQIERELAYQHEHDLWTGLYNRKYFEHLLARDLREGDGIRRAIISINISSVHELSMRYGFQYSQDIIRRIAWLLNDLCNQHTQLFNTYENRFVLYVQDHKDKEDLVTLGKAVSRTLDALLSIERIGWGIGIIEINEENRHDIEKLLRDLLIASERSLATFTTNFEMLFFDQAMESRLDREEAITEEIIRIATGENPSGLILQYQPIVDLKTNRICGFEALARVHSEQLGLVPPLEFIPIAEKTKLIIPVGERILRRACEFQRQIRSQVHEHMFMSINISPIQLLDKAFFSVLRKVMRETGVDPRDVLLEITESVVAFNFEEVNAILRQARALGVRIALDDFGTGYSSLSREREMQVNCIKIDRSFITKLMSLDPQEAITGDIVSMAHRLGHFVIAEGVEHAKQAAYLRTVDCDMMQGYLISKPVDAPTAISLLHTV